MEYICGQFPIDLEIQLSQTKLAQKSGFDSDQCSRALIDSDKYNRTRNRTLKDDVLATTMCR